MARKKDTLTLSVPYGTKEKLEAIALRLGLKWGSKPSPSALVTAIAQEDLEIDRSFELSNAQIAALDQAIKDLVDAGHMDDAKSVTTLLLDRGNLEAPLRRSLMATVSQPVEGWRIRLDQLIEQQQVFRLVYLNSQGQLFDYTVRYAEICFYEKRYYLQIWCEEMEDSNDLPELRHNRCLRLDRIQSVLETDGEWRGRFDCVEVTLQLRGGLMRAYESKVDDISDGTGDEVRQVVRRVVNSFWLIREVRRYGADCEIIAPQILRDRFLEELSCWLSRYSRAN